jgi:hypothetical protein
MVKTVIVQPPDFPIYPCSFSKALQYFKGVESLMHSDYPFLVQELLLQLHSLRENYPELQPYFSSAINGVEASKGRVDIGQTRLARLARISVAASGASVLDPIIEAGETHKSILRSIDRLMTLVREISGECEVEQEKIEDVPTPRGWRREGNAFVKKTYDEDIYTITKRSHIPGGQWTLFFFGATLSVKDNVGSAVAKANAFMALRNAARHTIRAKVPARPLPPAPTRPGR